MPKKRKRDFLQDVDPAETTARPLYSTSRTTQDRIVERANALDMGSFMNHYIDATRHTYRRHDDFFYISLTPAELLLGELDKCFALIEATSRKDYEPSSFGWHPRKKKEEMRQKEMKYLLVRRYNKHGSMSEEPLEGFLSFMITHDSTPSVPVLYIYEIHLSQSARGKGLGKRLINIAEHVARKIGLDKVMLTCFLSNERALKFYRMQGYDIDSCSPQDRKTRNKILKADYTIMSKEVPSNADDSLVDDSDTQVDDMLSELDQFCDADKPTRLDDTRSQMHAWLEQVKDERTTSHSLQTMRLADDCLQRGQVPDV